MNNNYKQRNNVVKYPNENNKYNEDYWLINLFWGDNNYNTNYRMNKNLKANKYVYWSYNNKNKNKKTIKY